MLGGGDGISSLPGPAEGSTASGHRAVALTEARILLLTCIELVAGLLLCVGGADAFVRGSARLAALTRVPPFLIGLTIVGFGTSVSELAVSTQAAVSGNAGIAVGNVVGSNITNLLLILGLAATIIPLVISSSVLRLHIPYMIGTALLLWLLGADGRLSRLDALVLLITFVGYMSLVVREMTRGRRRSLDRLSRGPSLSPEPATRRSLSPILLVAAGLATLLFGARWLVGGAVDLAARLGVSQLLIGLTIVAVGTSLPELVTSLVATVRGEREIAVGNVLGSNALNTAFVLGVSALVSPGGLMLEPSVITFEIPIMIIASAACLPVFFTSYTIDRWEGSLFLLSYATYLAHEILAAVHHRGILTLDLVVCRRVG